MKQKRKHTTSSAVVMVRAAVAVVMVAACGVALAAQASLQLVPERPPQLSHHAVVLGTPRPAATPRLTPTATPSPTPVPATPKPASKAPRVAVAPKTLPVVTPAPDSAVSHLVPATSASTPTPTPTGGLGSGAAAPALPSSYYTSTNWSGYMSPAGNFTGVSGSWTVPQVTGNGTSTSSDAAWIGIGGVTSNDLIQVGTDNTVSRRGHVTTTAFYELLPDAETPIPGMTVAPGDAMNADIHQLAGSQWQITINDVTRSETFTITVSYSSSLSSAEWIQEDPSFASGGLVPLDNFGPVAFTAAQATAGGVVQTAAAAGAQVIVLVDSGGHPVAVPSGLGADGQSFTVTRN